MTSPSDLPSYFCKDYFTARQRFLSLADQAGWTVASHPIAAKGPAGEPLFMDVAELPGRGNAAQHTVIVSSGLHGVEGFLGSAVQCAAIERVAAVPDNPLSLALSPKAGERGQCLSSRPRLVFVHALNPYGFAWIRRCNEDNVDLNRNFPSSGNTYRGSPPDYGMLNWLLNKPAPPSRWEPFQLLAMIAILRYGLPRLKRAIATGQYDYPNGLFYGGAGPCETTRFVQSQLQSWLGEAPQDAVHLDFHTGLGAAGDFQMLADVPLSPSQFQRVRETFGRDVSAGTQSPAVAYSARGSIGEWCQTAAGTRKYQYLCVEFGTDSPTNVLAALRAENRAQLWDRPGTDSYRWAKGLLKETFCPSSPAWRTRALEQGVDLVERAISRWPE